MSNQAKALRLADVIETFGGATAYQTAHELRRLHAVNVELLEALKRISDIELQEFGADWEEIEEAQDIANAAITKAEAA